MVLTITFPITFSCTDYAYMECAIRSEVNTRLIRSAGSIIGTKLTSTITIGQDTYEDKGGNWISIGY